jgi:hypothetical protein
LPWRLDGRRQLSDFDRDQRGDSFWWFRPRAFARLRRRVLCGPLDNIERNVVLEPEWVRESIVVTATGTPTPQAQTSAATNVLGPLDLALQDDLVSELRLMPGTFVVQSGQMGAVTSLFVRGGDSTSTRFWWMA